MTTATIQVFAGGDDGYEDSDGNVVLDSEFLYVDSTRPIAGLIFREIPIPRTGLVSSAVLELNGIYIASINCIVRGEISPADFDTAVHNLSARPKTANGVVWNNGTVYSPNIKDVIQEIVNYDEWAENQDVALFLIDRGLGGDAELFSYDAAAENLYLFLEWTVPVVADDLHFGWPEDYWPDEYWAEYWPDYGTATPGSIGPVAFMHLQRMHRRSSL